MTKNKILIGADAAAPLYEFDNADIREITGVTAVDIVGAELSIDKLTPKVEYDVDAAELWTPSDYGGILSSDGYLWATNRTFDDIRTLNYGEVVRYYHDGKLAGKFYVKNVDRISKDVYQINAMSAVGLLEAQRHYGGIYAGQTFLQVATDIIGSAVGFSCADDVAAVTIYGWLPIASKRKNLHQLLFATGTALTKDKNGDIRFVFLSTGAPKSVPDNRIYYGGNVDYSSPASAVEVTEHAFYSLVTDETVTLFDNTDGSGAADNTLVSFQDAPVHDLAVEGNLTIVSSGVNYAVVTGTGALTGKKYTHTSKVVRKETDTAVGEENVVTVTEATLVSVANSENVAKRMLAYYSSKKTVGAAIVLDGEQAGKQLAFNDPYDEATTGFLATMEINVSSNLKAQCTIITDYVPTGQGNNYNEVKIFSGSGTIVVPDGGAKVALIGGGQGGQSGQNGQNGAISASVEENTYGGEGGEGGEGGSWGKVLVVELAKGTYTYSCGVGGSGGVQNTNTSLAPPVSGLLGTDTVIYDESGKIIATSANGISSNKGYSNLFSGEIYATNGTSGVKAGKGGKEGWGHVDAESVTYNGQTWLGGANGEPYFGSQTGGNVGGGGSGAAVGQNGKNAGSSSTRTGADGVQPVSRAKSLVYGSGGDGGHGGSGAGAGGVNGGMERASGKGGIGGNGGDGGDGCIAAYYKKEAA